MQRLLPITFSAVKPFAGAMAAAALVVVLVGAPTASAATARFFVGSSGDIQAGDQVGVTIYLTAAENVNAIQGTVRFDPAALQLTALSNGGSIIPLWVDLPNGVAFAEINRAGNFSFSGIVPGGIAGLRNDEVLKLTFTARRAGETQVSLANAAVFLNDGVGTMRGFAATPSALKIVPALRAPRVIQKTDAEPPATFDATRSRHPSIFGGKWFVSFSTRDAESGVDHYEIAECHNCQSGDIAAGSWRAAQSPYVLRDQSLSSTVYVRAVDHAGNIQVAALPAAAAPLSHVAILAVIAAGLLAALLFYYHARSRRNR